MQKFLEMVHESGGRLNEIVTNLLKVAKLETNSSSVAKATLLLRKQVESVMCERR